MRASNFESRATGCPRFLGVFTAVPTDSANCRVPLQRAAVTFCRAQGRGAEARTWTGGESGTCPKYMIWVNNQRRFPLLGSHTYCFHLDRRHASRPGFKVDSSVISLDFQDARVSRSSPKWCCSAVSFHLIIYCISDVSVWTHLEPSRNSTLLLSVLNTFLRKSWEALISKW